MIFYRNAECGIPVEGEIIFKEEYRNVEISIHRKSDCNGWFLSCDALGFHDMELESTSPISAILESKRVIESRMGTMQIYPYIGNQIVMEGFWMYGF